MEINGVLIEDTFAEAFKMWGARYIVTAQTPKWAWQAATTATGFGTSVIGCKCETAIEGEVADTPDGRPGVSVLLFTASRKDIGDRLLERIGQCVMTCPTTACFNGLEAADELAPVGGKLRFFGDGYQISKLWDGRRYWRIPVMDGEFLVEEQFGARRAVGGGNFLIMGDDAEATLAAAEAAVEAIRGVPGAIAPFPGGVVRSGSKPGSKYKFLSASTNDAACPTLRGVAASIVPEGVNCVLEIVIDGLTLAAVEQATCAGIRAACLPGIRRISAGNYGGSLGQYQVFLHRVLEQSL